MLARKFLLAAVGVLALVATGSRAIAQQEGEAPAPPAQPAPPPGPTPAQIFERINAEIRELRAEETRIATERLARFTQARRTAEERAARAETRRDTAEARTNALDRAYEANAERIIEANELLLQHQGNLGELFGITRQVAGDVETVLEQSMLSALDPPPAEGTERRTEFLTRLAAATALPSYEELERLWYELQREMVNSSKVQKGEVLVATREDPTVRVLREVVTIGPFVAITDGEYLGYLPSGQTLAFLTSSMTSTLQEFARAVQAAPPGGYVDAAIDPSRGALLGLYLSRPGIVARIESGEEVAYLIIVVGAIGLLAALFQYGYLFVVAGAISRQLRKMGEPSKKNPLGRIVLAVRARKDLDKDPELIQLLISDAVLREIPALERFQAFLRLVIAAGPLLGLVGTVIGMIITFKAITAAGTSDPTLMARGIGQAMIATVLGLGVAIPLLFINSILGARSRRIGQTLDEQGFQLLAEVTGNPDLKRPPPKRA